MPKVSMDVPHSLTQEEATERVKKLVAKFRERNQERATNVREEWTDNKLDFGFKTYGFNIAGNVVVDADAVRLHGDLPFAAMMFKGRIEQEARDVLNRTLA